MLTKKTILRKLGQIGSVTVVLATFAFMAMAQDFPMHSGNSARTGLPVDINAGAFPPNQYNDIGRGFLRWWDPVSAVRSYLDNDENSGTGTTAQNPANSWTSATGARTVAYGYYQGVLGTSIYRYSGLVKGSNADDPTQSVNPSNQYTFTFTGLTAGSSYEMYFNLPVGPTDVGGIGTPDYRFPQKYWVVRVEGASGGNHVDVIDYDRHAGGFVRLGNNGDDTSTVFMPTGNTLTVRLYNIAPVGENGQYLDPNLNNDPTLINRQVVYADACQLVNLSKSGVATYVASPIVGHLNAPPIGGGVEQYPWRTTASRNETAVIGDLNRTYNYGITTSFDFAGATIGGPFSGRFNKIWSWPVMRPRDNSDAEASRFGRDKRDWLMATGKDRVDQKIQVDNLNGGASFTGGFVAIPGNASNIGPDYMQTASVAGAATQEATFTANIPNGNYFVDVWLPGDPGLAKKVTVNIMEGLATLDSLELDQDGAQGWVRIPFQPEEGYASNDPQPLSVVITNHTGDAGSVGRPIVADAVRFVRQADVGVDSTPLQATTTIQTGGGPVTRDVTLVAMENGRIYCMDAHGDPNTGAPPTVYWTYPTEGTPDPNAVSTEDGKDRIAEMPFGFDMSSAMVANVGGTDLLYIASRNGKVYCIEMSGRGDGTTRRRWTYPDDYDPTPGFQNIPMQPGLQPIVGSVAMATANGGVPVVLVPTQEGRILALDATGNAATRKTSIVWQYPLAIDPVLGPIRQTPVVAFGKVYFGAAPFQNSTVGHVYALNEADGTLAFDQDGAAAGGFARFAQGSPVAVPGAQLVAPAGAWNGTADVGADRIFVCDQSGNFASIDAANGNVMWNSFEIGVGAAGPLRFSYCTEYDNSGALEQDIPTVFVSGLDGRLTGMNAVGLQNKNNRYKVWGYSLDGQAQLATTANGGFAGVVPDHSWMYAADSTGFLYAFNSINDFSVVPLMPGVPPGIPSPPDNDPGIDELNNAIDPSKIVLLSPADYDDLREKSDSTGVATADVTGAVGRQIVRRHYDFGETLNILVYDLPTLGGANANYYLEIEVSSPGRPVQRTQVPVRPYSDNGNLNYIIRGIPLMTTGVGGSSPGPNFLTVRAVAPGNRGMQGTAYHLPKPPTFNPKLASDFFVANPLALAYLDNNGNLASSVTFPSNAQAVKIETDDSNARWGLYNLNGNSATDQNPTGGPVEPLGYVGPDLRSKSEPIAHGSVGVQQLYVFDRSLMTLLMGRGLSGVRVGPRDVAWVKDPGDPLTGGVYKPLAANGVSYPGFEDYPLAVPNTSRDYPDVGRDALGITANLFGQAQNPLYQSGIDLNQPTYRATDFQTYRSNVGFELQMDRNLSQTVFEMNLNVPRFQPPSKQGYYGSQVLFVDFQSGSPVSDPTQGPFRTFGLGLNVAVDERVSFRTPTIDLSSLPEGGAYNGGAGFGPLNPWDPTTAFSPWNPAFSNLFQTFSVANEGNVNNLNLRVAKYFFDANGNRPVELFMPGQHELAWLDASLHLHSTFDLRFSPGVLVGASAQGFDALGRNILQKPRPRDVIGTQFNVNPKSRPNANLRTAGNYLYDPNVITPGDPKVGVSAPIGAPAGQYIRKLFVFEDSDTGNNVNADNPSLGTNEPFTDPGANFKFTVRESRLTNRPTTKSAPMVENLNITNDNLLWSNTSPTAMRDGLGNMYVAWSSNRVDAANNIGWPAKQRVEGDLLNPEKWRIYVGSLRSILGNTLGESPINELNAWSNDAPDRWFRQSLVLDPPTTVFDVDTANGETLDLTTVGFGSPAFPTGGFFNQLDAPVDTGRQWFTGRYLAYIGEAVKHDSAGNATQLSQIMLTPIEVGADGSVTANGVIACPIDSSSRKSKLSLTEVGDNAAVYSSSFSNGLGQIIWDTYDGNTWRQGSLRLGPAFENLGSPSAVLRRYRNSGNQGSARVNLTFTGKIKGRRFSEVYMARLTANASTGFPTGRNPLQPYGTVNQPWVDEVTVDPATDVYWTPGQQWTQDQPSIDAVDIRTDPNNPATTIWDGDTNTRVFDVYSGVLKFNSKLGGEVSIDTNNGSIRFTGAVLKRNTRLFALYRPTILRVNEGTGANYRSAATAFDDRFIGVRVVPSNPQRNLLGDLQNWVGDPNPPTPGTALRWDRLIQAYTRTSGDGTAATRPFYQSMRPGVQLDYSIQTDQNGTATFFSVNWDVTGQGVPAAEHYGQFDPATGRFFTLAGNEDTYVDVTYDAVDENGRFVARRVERHRVRWIPEIVEQAVPIEQVGNESALSIAIDPLNGPFNNVDPQTGRRPGLLWLFWSSARTGQPDVFFQTVAPRFSPRRPNQ
ncbi:MAG: PQQ-binding-like beta-propeller repeat protein [Armatimonadetes bacterium]|nr:PQQ-binding-like beta-propeller repeat protein [Armatimonadota bacterium]